MSIYVNSVISRYNNCNKQYFQNEINRLMIKGDKQSTLLNHALGLKVFFDMQDDVDIRRLTQYDLALFLNKLDTLGYSDQRKQYIRRVIKEFYSNLVSKEFVNFIKIRQVWSTIKPQDLITKNELTLLIESCDSLRDKAILSLLYDAALRNHELLAIKLNDIDFTTNPVHISVNGKTGPRTIPLTFSAIYLKQYIDATPRFAVDGNLWGLKYMGLRKLVKKAIKRTGFTKRIYPYLFRHSRLTELGNNLTEAQLRLFAGWSGNSPMIRNYVHLSIKDLDKAIVLNCL